jgi:N-acetylmuramoyl-L-alanine amidase
MPTEPIVFPADAASVAVVRPSPNHGERRGRWAASGPDLIVLHYTGMPAGRGLSTGERAIRWLIDPGSDVSAHYVVDEDGRIVQLVAESRRAWHAGRSSWQGEDDVNSASIGIEIANPGHPWDLAELPDHDPTAPIEPHPGIVPYPEAQIVAVLGLVADICARRGIDPTRVVGHSDVAPLRRRDPGEFFPWERLEAAGFGLAVAPEPIGPDEVPQLRPGVEAPPVAAVQAMLALAGYGIAVDGVYGDETRAVLEAFQRRHRPMRVDGLVDRSTLETLRRSVERRRDAQGRSA